MLRAEQANYETKNEENYEQFRARLETDGLCCDKTHTPLP
jgi:hypothetical protein